MQVPCGPCSSVATERELLLSTIESKTYQSDDLEAVGIGYLHYEIQNESTILGGTTSMRIVPLHGLNQIYAR